MLTERSMIKMKRRFEVLSPPQPAVHFDLFATVVLKCKPRTFLRLLPLSRRLTDRSRSPYLWLNYLSGTSVTRTDSPHERYHRLLIELAKMEQYGQLVALAALSPERHFVIEDRTFDRIYEATTCAEGKTILQQLITGALRKFLCEQFCTSQPIDDQSIDLAYELKRAGTENNHEQFVRVYQQLIAVHGYSPVRWIIEHSIARTTSIDFFLRTIAFVINDAAYQSYRFQRTVDDDIDLMVVNELLSHGKFELVTELLSQYTGIIDREQIMWANIIESPRNDSLELYSSFTRQNRDDIYYVMLRDEPYYVWVNQVGAIGAGELLERYIEDYKNNRIFPFRWQNYDPLEIILASFRALPAERFIELVVPLLTAPCSPQRREEVEVDLYHAVNDMIGCPLLHSVFSKLLTK